MKKFGIRRNDILSYLVYFVLLVLFTDAGTVGGIKPFGLALFTALVFSRKNIVLLAPMFLVAKLVSDFSYQSAISAVVPSVLYVAVYFVYHKLGRPMHVVAALAVTLASLVPDIVFSVLGGDISGCVLSGVITLVFSYVFITALHAVLVRKTGYRFTTDEKLACVVSAGALALALYNVRIGGFNLLYPFFAFMLIFSAYTFKTVQAPLILGLATALGAGFQGGGAEAIAIISVTAGVAAAFRNLPPLASVIAISLSFLFGTFYFNTLAGGGYVNAIAVFAGATLYVCIPKKYRNMFDASALSYTSAGKSVVNKNRREMSLRLYSLAGVFEDMRDLLTAGTGKENKIDPDALAYDVAANFCGRCENSANCFASLGGDTTFVLKDVVATSVRKGKASIIDMPPFITGRCKSINGLIAEVNSGLKRLQNANEEIDEAEKGKAALASEMGGVAEVLDNLADEFKRPLSFDGRREIKIADELVYHGVDCKEVLVYGDGADVHVTVVVSKNDADKAVLAQAVSRIMKVRLERCGIAETVDGYVGVQLSAAPRYDFVYGEAFEKNAATSVSGDVRLVKRLTGGRAIIALGDGMGSGKDAENLGMRAVRTVENFYEAGFSSDVVLDVSNKILTRHSDGDGYSTLDIVVLDLNSGAADFIKSGAAYTMLKHGGNPEIIEGNALPVGVIENIKPYVRRTVLAENDVAVIMSDGIADALSPSAIAELLAERRRINPEVLADDILKLAKENGATDDLTVIAVKIFSRA